MKEVNINVKAVRSLDELKNDTKIIQSKFGKAIIKLDKLRTKADLIIARKTFC